MNVTTSNGRLLKLADFLDTLPRERFDYSTWVGMDWKGAQNLSCGTKACALGWAATIPEFRRLGLRLSPYREVINVKTGAEHSNAAAQHTFGLTESEARLLFEGVDMTEGEYHIVLRSEATPKQVATHIRRFVKHRAELTA
jgi:hypothetical protein